MSIVLASQIPCRFALVGLIALLASSVAGRAADWPQWGGRAERNMVSDEAGLPETFSRGTREREGGIDSQRRETSNGSSNSARRPTAIPPLPTGACMSAPTT